MKLTKVKIYGFGKWVDKEFDFNSDYQVIFGPNEAGKTTLLTFIKSILFGFATARGDDKYQQYKPKQANSYGGELQFRDDDGTVWTVKRVDGKSGGDLMLYRGDQQVPENLLADKITRGFTKEDFEDTHVIDDNNILSIYKLDEEQLETEILAVGAVGSKEWLLTADQLESSADETYKPRGRKQPLSEAIDRRKTLISKKSEFANQQTAYQQINGQVSQTEEMFDNNNQEFQIAQKQKSDLQRLYQKWPKYSEYLQQIQHDNKLDNPISDEDWEQALKTNQELTILQQNKSSVEMSHLSDTEERILKNYQINKNDLDYLSAKKNSIRDLQYQKHNSNEQLKSNDLQIDNLISSNPQYDEKMRMLTEDEMSKLNRQFDADPVKTPLNIPLAVVSVIGILLALFTSGFLRIIGAIVAIAGLGFIYYQQSNGSKVRVPTDIDERFPFLVDKGYQGMSIEQVKSLQPVILQIYSLRNKQNAIENTLANVKIELNKWKNYLNNYDLLISGDDDYAQAIDDYFSKLQNIQTRSEMIEKSNSELKQSQKSNFDKITELVGQLKYILAKYSVSDFDGFTRHHTKQIDNKKIIDAIDRNKAVLGDDIAKLQEYSNLNSLKDQLVNAEQKLNELSIQNNKLNRQVGSLKNQRKQMFDNQEYQNLIDELAQNKSDIIELYDEWLADKLSSKWIHQMLNAASENRYPKMLDRASKYFSLLTNNNYIDIEFSSLANKRNLKVTRQDKTKFDVHELSKATTVQLYISLRMAFVSEISDLVDLPILIDDAFVDFDKIRTGNMFELVKEVSKVNQIIYVTANMTVDLPKNHVINVERGS
ncbi:ATP-binding protein [Companilactobacillus hulinensis]|uniref:ATP-binding protein n=1 Tax=Companilactobacillus hulinensis TaxID=2486007 RepID=UPI0013DDD7E1|nr:AAA family ATPase [Companilactobacillus hulinensis]